MSKKYRSVYINGERYIEEVPSVWVEVFDWVITIALTIIIFALGWHLT